MGPPVTICARCDTRFSDIRVQCPSCGFWNPPRGLQEEDTILASDVPDVDMVHVPTGPWDKCFGGGLVPGCVFLLAGSPGVGKSTMVLHMGDVMCEKTQRETLLIGKEQALTETKQYMRRIGVRNLGLFRLVKMGVDVNMLGNTILSKQPAFIILDSLAAACGNDLLKQVSLAKTMKQYAVALDSPILMIHHVNADNEISGLTDLQHEVDWTGLFTPDKNDKRKPPKRVILKGLKSRVGPSNISVELDMGEEGLTSETR